MTKKAFTLVEMIIAITIFTVFIGFAMSGYLVFHRAQQEVAISRSVLMESEEILSVISSAIKADAIFFDDPFESDTLVLKEASGTSKTVFHFDSNEEKMTVQKFSVDDYGNFQPADGFLQPLALHSDTVKVELAEFRIVPSADPYDAANIISGDKLFWYQPIVQFKLMTYAQGRVREKIELEFQTSVTSRKYQ